MYNYFVIQMVANLFELLLNWQIINFYKYYYFTVVLIVAFH